MSGKTENDLWIEMSIREIWTQAHYAERAYQNINLKAQGDIDVIFSSIHSFLSHCAMVSKLLKADEYNYLKAKAGIRSLTSCVYSFLLCCARSLKIRVSSQTITPSNFIGTILGIPVTSLIHKRSFRNHLEHYDERLKSWIKRYGVKSIIGTYNVGPKSMIKLPNAIYVNHYDPSNNTFTFVNENFDLSTLYVEVRNVKGVADKWVQDLKQGKVIPPFG